jgi:plastocyanin
MRGMNRWLNHTLIFLAVIIAILLVAGCTGTERNGTPTPTPTATPDLTNQNSAQAAGFTAYPSLTKLQTPAVPVGSTGLVSTTAKTATATPVPTAAGQPVSITLTAQNTAFSATTLTAPARSLVVMTFVNKDANMPHNFALYSDSRAKITSRLFAGDLVIGPKTVEYTFVAPSTPGNYFFRCDYHPELMTGTFVVT